MNVSINHPTDRPNFCVVTVGDLSVWFSYRTPVAYQYGSGRIVVRENDWSTTTGKHLTYIDGGDKRSRVPGDVFMAGLEKVLPKDVSMRLVTELSM